MEKSPINPYDKMFLSVAIAGAIFGIFPGFFIIPFDKVYEFFTGTNYVDITKGMLAYIVFIPIVAVVTFGYATRLIIKQKKITKLSSFLLILVVCHLAFWFLRSGIL